MKIFALAFEACEKEIKQENVRYTGYYVRSPKDASKWITIEEYNKIMSANESEKIGGRGRNWVECFYRDGEVYRKGKTCSTAIDQGCSEAEGCRGGKCLP